MRQFLPIRVLFQTHLGALHCVSQRRYSGAFQRSAPLLDPFHYRKKRMTPEDTTNPLEKPSTLDKGALHVVSVPIGNLKDFTYRAIEVLQQVDYIITTDRPATKTLLDLVQIPNQGRLIHYSKSNHTATHDRLVDLLKGGRSLALVTTSGTPCVGDVGSDLVQAMQASGVRVTAVPGASAVMCALSVCGVTYSSHELAQEEAHTGPADMPSKSEVNALRDGSFYFGNFLPDSHGARLRVIRNVVGPSHYPCVFYELPRRLLMTLQDIAAVLPQRRVFITHELTKLNESFHADTAERLVAFYLKQESVNLLKMGQLVIVVAGAGPQQIAAWLQREAEKRRRMRHSADDLLALSAEKEKSMHGTVSGKLQGDTATSRNPKPKKSKRKVPLGRKRRLLMRQIRHEKEKLRLNFSANKKDASVD